MAFLCLVVKTMKTLVGPPGRLLINAPEPLSFMFSLLVFTLKAGNVATASQSSSSSHVIQFWPKT